ncbi:D-alanine-D-alanine ligase [Nakamurella sp. UYEF19]|uniref:D-alanine--D-alanine ligase family protein n=1 Tax=Nakamurella sp. UYEF19 TaxID=1756392 RepID=UPI003393A7BA
MTLRVLHLTGSAVSDFLADLSRLYAADCLEATADSERYDFHIAYVTPDLLWRFPVDLSQAAISAAAAMSVGDAIRHIAAMAPGVVVPQMFCVPGMTSYRSLFDVLGVPFVGNRPEVMALTANKAHAKAVVAAAGVLVPAGETVRRGDRPSLALPVVVKPVDGDNSLGVTLVRAPHEFAEALDAALEHSDEALVESFVQLGREVRCGIIVRDGELICLPLEEYNVDSATKPIRNHDDKISRTGGGELNLVAKDSTRAWMVALDDPITRRVWEVARQCHVALGCRHYSLFDFRIDPSGQPWFLEAGLYSSFARKSVISMMAKAAGIGLDELFETAVRESLRSSSFRGSNTSPKMMR